MRIINLIQKNQLRGAEIFACQLSEHLVKKGHEVIVVCIYDGESKLPFNGKIIKLKRNPKYRFWDILGWKKFAEIVNKFRPHVVQANASDTLKFSVSSKCLFNWKSKIVFRNANKMGGFIDAKWKLKLNSFYLSKIDYVISVSKECEIDFIETFDFSLSKIETIQIGVEEKRIGEPPKDLAFIFENFMVITHIAGFVPEKNHQGLLEIIKKASRKFPNLKVLLLGEGRLKQQIQNLSKKLGLEENIMFLGYRDDVLEILAASDVFVLPSLIEGLPGVILEAMYCETPVIANNVGGIKEVVMNDKTGYLIEKDESEVFLEALLLVLTKKESTTQLTQDAKKMIEMNFMNTKISDRFIEAYHKIQ